MVLTWSIDPEILLDFLEEGAIYCRKKGNIKRRKKIDKMPFKVDTYIILKRIPIHSIPTVHYGTVKTLKKQNQIKKNEDKLLEVNCQNLHFIE